MGQGHAPLEVVNHDRLYVALVVRAGGGIAHMAHRDVPLSQGMEPLGREHLADQPHIAAAGEYPLIVDHDSGALLAPVLQSEQAVIGQTGHILLFGTAHPKHTALLMEVPLLLLHTCLLLSSVTVRWRRSWTAPGRRGHPRRSPPSSCWASRSRPPSPPGRDNTSQRVHGKEETLW